MKFLNLILLVLTISACCGASHVAEQSPENESEEIAQIEVAVTIESSEPIEENVSGADLEIEETPIETEPEVIAEDLEIEESPSPPTEVFDHGLWNELLQKHVSDQGNVNYKGFISDNRKLNSYLSSLSDNPPQESWSSDEALAYWMNVYNAFTVKLILNNYPLESIKDIDGPWNYRFIKIGPKWYTLNDVEHRIIRKMDEPRIHFALVCAAVSCPRLYNKAFTATDLDKDLALLTRGFLNDPSKNRLSNDRIQLSKIFKWYGGDFKKNGNTLIGFLREYSGIEISNSAKKSYLDYNWALNE